MCHLVISNYLWFEKFVILIYLKSQNIEIYEITAKLIYSGCLLYLCMQIYIIHCAETISVTRNFRYLQYSQKRKTLVYLKFYCFERPLSAVWLLEMEIIGSYVRIHVNVCDKQYVKGVKQYII